MIFLLLICSFFLLLGIANLPIGYYTFLRIFIFIVALIILIKEFKNGIKFWTIAFGIIAIIFNPLIPVYLYEKDAWMPIDLIAAILFGIKSYILKKNNNSNN